jgi:beta-lactamase regulating signal transducer with metallopeptidase domain
MSVADIVLLISAVGGLVTVVTAAVVNLRRIDSVKTELKQEVKEVHKIVNQQRTDMLAYQKTLIDALVSSGIHVPTDKALLKE